LFEKINFALLLEAREAAGREASPSAGVIDSQSVKTTESGGPRGYDAAKKIKGRKRHIVTDTGGLLVGAEVHPADIQDRDGAVLVIEAIHQLFPWLRHLFADSVYNGPNLRDALAKFGNWTIEIVKRAADAAGFKLLPRRWVVERTLAWLNRNRRLAKDFDIDCERQSVGLHRLCAIAHQKISLTITRLQMVYTTYTIKIRTLSQVRRRLPAGGSWIRTCMGLFLSSSRFFGARAGKPLRVIDAAATPCGRGLVLRDIGRMHGRGRCLDLRKHRFEGPNPRRMG
jgi:transposase